MFCAIGYELSVSDSGTWAPQARSGQTTTSSCHPCSRWPVLIFFFQAEDGIRDDLVTGVQTCALPICPDLDRESTQPRSIRKAPRAGARPAAQSSDRR